MAIGFREGGMRMNENRFELAGWAAIASAALLPTAFVIGGLEQAAFGLGSCEPSVGLGVSDFILLLFGAVSIYVYLMLKRMLYERYSFRKADVVIALTIAWTVVNYAGSFLLQLFFSAVMPDAVKGAVLITTIFWMICIGVFGIIDVILSLILIVNRERFGTPMRVFAILYLLNGLLELTVIFSFVGLLVFPAAFVALAVAFLKPDESLEFV